jgi:hypothetical protein
MIRLPLVPLLAGPFLSLMAVAASAQTVTFTVPLDGMQEVPPVSPAGTGTATLTLDVATRLVSISGSYTGLTSNQTLAHLHGPAPRGMNAGVLITLVGTGGTSGTFSGSATLSNANVTNLLNNLTYLNIHTMTNGGGEIRGQVEYAGSSVECNGTGVNPIVLTNTSATAPAPAPPMNSPVIGKNLRLTLDCNPNGTIGGTAIFRIGFGPKPAPMLSKWGEILVPITAGTGQNFFATVSGTGMADLGPILLPSSGAFVGATYTVQGFCPASPDGYLSNARAETVGTL